MIDEIDRKLILELQKNGRLSYATLAQKFQISVPTVSRRIKRLSPRWLFSGLVADALEKVSNCTECGECEERCPYHLPITKMMKDYYDQYEIGKKEYQRV